MKLNKDTKWGLRIGDFLYGGKYHSVYRVANLWEGGFRAALYITVDFPDGRRLYGGRSSDFYGLEIVNENSPEELYESAASLWRDLGGKLEVDG